jgi:hypothetical protein
VSTRNIALLLYRKTYAAFVCICTTPNINLDSFPLVGQDSNPARANNHNMKAKSICSCGSGVWQWRVAVACPGILFGGGRRGVQQIRLRTDSSENGDVGEVRGQRENGDLGAVAP